MADPNHAELEKLKRAKAKFEELLHWSRRLVEDLEAERANLEARNPSREEKSDCENPPKKSPSDPPDFGS